MFVNISSFDGKFVGLGFDFFFFFNSVCAPLKLLSGCSSFVRFITHLLPFEVIVRS